MKIGLFGGSFDPVHIAHLIIPQYIKEELGLAKIIFIPSGSPPHKEVYAPKELRRQMVQAAIADNPDFECSDIEIVNPATSYTVETIARLQEEMSATPDELFWIIGSDSFIDFPNWKDPRKILQMCQLAVFPRDSGDYDQAPAQFKRHHSVHLIDAPIVQISSTHIRNAIRQGRSIKYLVPPVIESLIQTNALYR